MDGSLTGTAGGSILPSMKILNPNHCSDDETVSHGVPGSICNQGHFRRMAWNNVHPSSIDGKEAFLTNQHGTDTVIWRKKSKTGKPEGYTALLTVGDTFHLTFANSSQFTNISFDMSIAELKDDESAIMQVFVLFCRSSLLF